ncbi:MAG: hypothetical protein Q8M16_15165 [Pirellulaceae bacterium]|nr:hypothetical protein [Pirellulaceae bacterium]
MKKISIWVIVGLGAVYLGLLIWYYRGIPQPSVDFSQELNRSWELSTPSERAWPELREIIAQVQTRDDSLFNDFQALQVNPDDSENWGRVAATVRRYREVLEQVRMVSTRPYLGFPFRAELMDYTDEDFAVLFPGEIRELLAHQNQSKLAHPLLVGSISAASGKHTYGLGVLVQAIIADCYEAAESQDAERTTKNLETALQLSWYVSETDIPLLANLGIGLRQQIFTCLDWLLAKNPELFETVHLQRLQNAIEHVPEGFSYGVDGEQIVYLDFVQRVYTDDGNGDGRLTPTGLDLLETISFDGLRMFGNFGQAPRVRTPTLTFDTVQRMAHRLFVVGLEPVGVLSTESRKNALDRGRTELEQLRHAVEKPWDFPDPYDGFMWRQIHAVNGFSPAMNVLRPYQFSSGMVALDKISRNSLVAGLATIRFRREQGRYPASWDDLVGTYLKAAPIDAWQGEELKLLVSDQQFKIYSIAPDRVDDAGKSWVLVSSDSVPPSDQEAPKPPRQRSSRFEEFELSDSYDNRDVKGDWILFPWH